MKKDIQIGLAAYNNSYWKGIFYPDDLPASKRFEFYCRHFSMYEINATFYKFPTDKSMKAWYDKSPDNFLFSVKAPKAITHSKRFNNVQEDVEKFYTICSEGLKEKLGFVLFQLPPSFDYSPEKLSSILNSLNTDFKNVVEFRNASWWIPEVFDALRAKGIIFCSVSYPKLSGEVIATTPAVYVRLHGVPKLFYSGYSPEKLQKLKNDILADDTIASACICFNNTAGKEGILNALEMKNSTAI